MDTPSSRPARGGVTTVGEAIQSFLRSAGLDAHRRDGRVVRAWSEAVGTQLARRARAVRFRDGELTVEVSSAAHLQELAGFTGEAYRVRANEILGAETIRRVHFKAKA